MTKTALITGITGQDGSYLAELLLSKGYSVHGIIRRTSTFNTQRIIHVFQDPHETDVRLELHYGDITDSASLSRLIKEIEPNEVYNLAAQSHVRVSFDMPQYTAMVTGVGTISILDAIRQSGQDIRFYQASSSEIFGSSPPPQNEDTLFRPRSPYAAAKLYAHWITDNYREAYGMFNCSGILFNHESPRRGRTFVTRKVTHGVAEIVAGQLDAMYFGNLDAKRDWGYAPEYVEFMWKMLQADKPEDYVCGTGESHSVRDLIEESFSYAGLDWEKYIRFDERYLRPSEVEFLLSDPSKARKKLGWNPKVKFKELVRIMVDYDMKSLGLEPPGEGFEFLEKNNLMWSTSEETPG
ncbi:MAG: GDP-mannose 4,6-dehydratase [Candidatus Thorarchaeota archaeon]|jgi:GDPmannose 4,6-dehydratase